MPSSSHRTWLGSSGAVAGSLGAASFVALSLGLSTVACGSAEETTEPIEQVLAPLYRVPGAQQIADQYIVVLKKGTPSAPTVARSHGVTPRNQFRKVFKGFTGHLSQQRLEQLRADPNVAFVQQDAMAHAYALLSDLVPTGINRAQGEVILDDTLGNMDVDIAILDTGIDLDHPDLNVASSADCLAETEDGSCEEPSAQNPTAGDDDNGHGTHVAGTAAALYNDQGVVGMAPGARLHAVKVLDSTGGGPWSSIIRGLERVLERGDIEVVNMSLGGPGSNGFPNESDCDNIGDAIQQAICNVVKVGIPVVVAAGNDGIDAAGAIPAAYQQTLTVGAFSDLDGVPGALFTDYCWVGFSACPEVYVCDDSIACFSNYGPAVDIMAPGVGIASTLPDGQYSAADWHGTSMATPHVTGTVARIIAKSTNPVSPEQIRDMLVASATVSPCGPTGESCNIIGGNQFPLLMADCGGDGDCDDDKACNGPETCDDGTCVTASPVECGAGETCNTETGLCESPSTDISFRQGQNGYTGTVDTFLMQSQPQANNGNLNAFEWSGEDPANSGQQDYGLLRFNNLFESEGGPIPDGSIVTSASLAYVVFNDGDAGAVYESTVDFDESTTYETFGSTPGVQLEDYSDFIGQIDASSGAHELDVTSSVAKWAQDPAQNLGFIVIPTGPDDAQVRSSEYFGQTSRPLLQVTFTAKAPCNADTECGDSDECTVDLCVDGECNHAPVVCDDANACNGLETCDSILGCLPGTPMSCDDGDVCNGSEACDPAAGCQAGTPPSCDDGNACNGVETCDSVAGCQTGTALVCDDGLLCNGVETCDEALGCLPGVPPCADDGDPCTAQVCDEATGCNSVPVVCDDGDSCTVDACDPVSGCGSEPVDCDDGDPCTVDACDPASGCTSEPVDCDDGDPCTADACDLGACTHAAVPGCATAPTARLETGTLLASGSPTTVGLAQNYVSPVVVSSVRYQNNAVPVVARISNVTETSFDIRLQNPSDAAVNAESVDYLVMEEGVWNVDGLRCEARTYTSTVTDSDSSWVGEEQSYGQSYANPVVFGQVMSENDARWSAFWSRGSSATNPASAALLFTGKEVGEDPDSSRLDEEIGFVVCEAGQGSIAGAKFEIAVGADSVQGAGDSPPYLYNFSLPFSAAPTVALVNQSAMDGPNGGWAQLHGNSPVTASTLALSIDEDQAGDSERNHTTEQVAYAAFETNLTYPGVCPPSCDDADPCTVDFCEGARCVHEPMVCDDGDACTNDACNPADGMCNTTPFSCDDGNACTNDSCNPVIGCVNTAVNCDDGDACNGVEACDPAGGCQAGTPLVCDDGLACNGVETCEPSLGCRPGTSPCVDDGDLCTTEVCDELSGCSSVPVVCDDGDVCTSDACDPGNGQCDATPVDCDDGDPCTADSCDSVSGCSNTPVDCDDGDPCTADACDLGGACTHAEIPDCATTPAARLETGTLAADGSPTTVSLTQSYASPVVVSSVRYQNNAIPVVTRISNVTENSFDIRLQNPSDAAVSAETVDYWVMEEGVWNFEGLPCEAQQYVSTRTDNNSTWVGEEQGYGQSYSNPIVFGQVMTENDPRWSAFWSHGSSATSPASAAVLFTGKEVGEDPDRSRLDEQIGFIVCEAARGSLGGVAFELALGADSVQGVGDSPPYRYGFASPFSATPAITLVSQSAMDGNNGGWAQLHGSSPVTTSSFALSIDEDQAGDSERSHTTEQVAYAAFETNLVYPDLCPPSCDDANPCTVDTCDGAGCVHEPMVCDDSDACTLDACDPMNGLCGATPLSCDDGDACTTDSCNPQSGCVQTPVDCDDQDPCTADSCSADGTCAHDSIPDCSNPSARLETGIIMVGGSPVSVPLRQTYVSPVIVSSVRYQNNAIPVVTRIGNVTGGSFDIRLQNPSGSAVVAEDVDYLVMEEGVWDFDGLPCEAQQYTSTVTDGSGGWVGEQQSYGQGYSSPVVFGQVMSENDPRWSAFWSRGSSATNPASPAALYTGKQVAEDPDSTRLDEQVGFIVCETAQGSLAGAQFEIALGSDSVQGVDDSPPDQYSFSLSFDIGPAVAIVSQSAMDGPNGGWAQLFGPASLTASTLALAIDEDQVGDAERNHTTEQVGYAAFSVGVVYTGQ